MPMCLMTIMTVQHQKNSSKDKSPPETNRAYMVSRKSTASYSCSTGDQPKILYKPAKPSISQLHLQPTRQTCWQHWDLASQVTLSQLRWKTTSNLGFCYHPTIKQARGNIPGPRTMFLPCTLLQEAIKCSLLILVEHVKRRPQAPRKSESEVGTGGGRRTRNSKLNQLHTDLKASLGYKIPC